MGSVYWKSSLSTGFLMPGFPHLLPLADSSAAYVCSSLCYLELAVTVDTACGVLNMSKKKRKQRNVSYF